MNNNTQVYAQKVDLLLMGASRPQTPLCFLVLDYLFSSTRNCSSMLNLRLILETCKEISKNLISPS